jgi:hypothetical protein
MAATRSVMLEMDASETNTAVLHGARTTIKVFINRWSLYKIHF